MMGKQQKQDSFFTYNVKLDERVPENHPLRKVKGAVDFSFVRSRVSHTYGHNGNESIDPEVIMKLMFLLFFDNISSERELMRQVSYRMDYLWFLDLSLEDDIPDHSVLSKARSRWGPLVFEGFFIDTILQSVKAGLVCGSKLHFDGSLVDADASTDSVVKGSPELISALKELYRSEERKLEVLDDKSDEEAVRPSDYKPVNDGLMSRSDPDTAVVSKKGVPPRPRYKNHRAVDDAHGVITAVESTSGDVSENSRLLDLIDQSETNTGIKVSVAVADSQYGTVENFRECSGRGIKSHMSDFHSSSQKKVKKSGIYDESDFKYDPNTDTYTCPAGKTLKRRRHKKSLKAYEYSTKAKVCRACELRINCTSSKNGRSVKRHYDQELIDAARAQSRSSSAKKDRRRRKHLMEVSFADAANNHGFKRSRWRRLWRQRIQDFMIAACQNIRILIKNAPLDSALYALKSVNNVGNSLFSALIGRIFDLYGRFRLHLGYLNLMKITFVAKPGEC
jgi:transposase